MQTEQFNTFAQATEDLVKNLPDADKRLMGQKFWQLREQWLKESQKPWPNPFTRIASLLDPPVGGA